MLTSVQYSLAHVQPARVLRCRHAAEQGEIAALDPCLWHGGYNSGRLIALILSNLADQSMQLYLMLAQLETLNSGPPSICPNQACSGAEFRLHQKVVKPLKDTLHQSVTVYRYQCLRCRRTFRVYPQGVTHAHTSMQVQALGVLLYFLGLSFGAVSGALDGLGIYLSKSRVYDAVKLMKSRKPELTRRCLFQSIQRQQLPRGVVHVQCMQQSLPLTLLTTGRSGLMLDVATLSGAEIAILQERITPLLNALNGELFLSAEHTV